MLLNVFERIFFQVSRASRILLIDFLNAALGDSVDSLIESIQPLSASNLLLSGKQLNRAFGALTEDGEQLSIRLYLHQSDYFHSQTSPALVNFKERPVDANGKSSQFVIHLLNFNLLQESLAYHHCYYTSPLQNFTHPDTQVIHYLELPKFTSDDPKLRLEKWLYFIKCVGQKESCATFQQLITKEPIFKLAAHLYNRVHIDQKGAIVVKEQPLDLSDWQDLGHQIEKERIALKMIEAGFPYRQIIEFTDLSLAELDALALTIPLIES